MGIENVTKAATFRGHFGVYTKIRIARFLFYACSKGTDL